VRVIRNTAYLSARSDMHFVEGDQKNIKARMYICLDGYTLILTANKWNNCDVFLALKISEDRTKFLSLSKQTLYKPRQALSAPRG